MKPVKRKFSLVLATLGRDDTVDLFLASLASQDYPSDLVEVIIVDQNTDGRLDEIVTRHRGQISLIHIKSPIRGLSLNRNIGLNHARGDIVGFPDDDCEYPHDLLSKVDASFNALGVDVLLGRIWDRKQNKSAIRNWPGKTIALNSYNFYRLTSSITLFTKVVTQRFDERFGLGAQYGSNEDVIFVSSLLRSGATGQYVPSITVYHEDQPLTVLSREKVTNYALGFGRFAREYRSMPVLAIFLFSVLFQALHLLKALGSFDMRSARLRAASLRGRIRGFLL